MQQVFVRSNQQSFDIDYLGSACFIFSYVRRFITSCLKTTTLQPTVLEFEY